MMQQESPQPQRPPVPPPPPPSGRTQQGIVPQQQGVVPQQQGVVPQHQGAVQQPAPAPQPQQAAPQPQPQQPVAQPRQPAPQPVILQQVHPETGDGGPTVLEALLRFAPVVLVATLLFAGLAYGWSSTQETVVPARGKIVLSAVREPAIERFVDRTSVTRVDDEVLRASSTPVFEAAAAALGISVEEMRSTVRTTADDSAEAIVVDARAGTAADSIARVNAVIEAYRVHSIEVQAMQITAVIEQVNALIVADDLALGNIESRLAEVDAGLSAESAAGGVAFSTLASLDNVRTGLRVEQSRVETLKTEKLDQLARLNTALTASDDGIDFVREADGPSGNAEPNTKRNVAAAGGLGLVIGTALAWSLADRAPRRRRSR